MGKNKRAVALAYLALVLYAAPVGFSFMAVKVSVGVGSSLQLLTFRFTAAFLAASLLRALGFVKLRLVKGTGKALALTALPYVGFLGFQAFGLLYTTSIISGILFAVVPIFTRLIGGLVLKEGSTLAQNLFALLSVGAVVAMFAIGAGDALRAVSLPGFLLLLISSLSCALSNVYMRVVKQSYPPLAISYTCCATGCALFWAMALIQCLTTGDWAGFFAPLAQPSYLGAAAYLGLFCTLITGALISYALRTLPAMSATIFGNLSTAISVVAGALVLGEPLYGYQLVCTLLIIAGVLGISLSTGRQAARQAPPAGGQ